jgi:polyisoprenoid-binding protein YceI
MFNLILIILLFERGNPPEVSNTQCFVKFSILNAGFEVEGTLRVKDAQIDLDPENLHEGFIKVYGDASSIETGIPIRDKHLRRSDFFDAVNYPEILLKSKSFKKTGRNEYRGTFDLTIKSVTKQIIISFVLSKKGESRYCEGEFEINRLEFGVGEESLTLDEVVHIKVNAVGKF